MQLPKHSLILSVVLWCSLDVTCPNHEVWDKTNIPILTVLGYVSASMMLSQMLHVVEVSPPSLDTYALCIGNVPVIFNRTVYASMGE